MDLSIIERLLLLPILPAEGNLTTLRIARKLRESLSFSEKEHEDYESKQEGNEIKWNVAGQQYVKDVEIGPKALVMVEDALRKLDKDGKVTNIHLILFDKFKVEELEEKA